MTTPILMTGGTGNIGSRVVRRLRAAGTDVRIISCHPLANEPGIEYVPGDIVAGTSLTGAVAAEGAVHAVLPASAEAHMSTTSNPADIVAMTFSPGKGAIIGASKEV
jgi:nucleoside-diphosphate-sugar epimerase